MGNYVKLIKEIDLNFRYMTEAKELKEPMNFRTKANREPEAKTAHVRNMLKAEELYDADKDIKHIDLARKELITIIQNYLTRFNIDPLAIRRASTPADKDL